MRRFSSFSKWFRRKPKPLAKAVERRVFPSSDFPILEREKLRRGWDLLEEKAVSGPMAEEKLKQALIEWGKTTRVSRSDAVKLLTAWGVPREKIERISRALFIPKQ